MLKNLIIITLNILIILVSAFGLINLKRAAKLSVANFNIGSYPYSVSLSPQEDQNAYYRISPYDDTLIYEGEKFEKIANWDNEVINEKETGSIRNNITSFFNLFTNNHEVAFVINGKYSERMNVAVDGNSIQIRKSITPITDNLLYFDNLLNINNGDIVFDDMGDAYIGDTELVLSLGLKSRFVQTSIVDIEAGSNVYIYNPKSSSLIKVFDTDNSIIRIDREYGYVIIREITQPVGGVLNSDTYLEIVPVQSKLII